MDYDISRWLKDDLGLVHMTESDLNSLLYHPRHGSLCRRLVKFLAESTLCNQKYPDVYAQEEYLGAVEDLNKKNDELRDIVKQVENFAKDNEDQDREMNFLKMRLAHLKKIEDLQRTSTKALEEIANRPNMEIELVTRNIEEIEYLSNTDLNSLYPTIELNKSDSAVTTRQMTAVDEELNDLMKKAQIMHQAITMTLRAIVEKMENTDSGLNLRKTSAQNLIALRLPKIEEVTLDDMEPAEKELKENNVELSEKVCELNQQVTELSRQYESRRAEMISAHKKELEKCLNMIISWEEIESVLQNVNSCR